MDCTLAPIQTKRAKRGELLYCFLDQVILIRSDRQTDGQTCIPDCLVTEQDALLAFSRDA